MGSVQDLKEVFCNYGELDSVKIFYVRRSGFVTYRNRQAADTAIRLCTHLVIKGSTLVVRWAKPRIKDNSKKRIDKIVQSEKIKKTSCEFTHLNQQESFEKISAPAYS